MAHSQTTLSTDAAHRIASDLLHETGDAMTCGDFSRFSECFLLPQKLETPAGRRTIQTEQELRRTFDTVRALHERNRISHVVRHCVEAAFRDEATIVSTYETRIVTHDLLLKGRPFPALSILKHTANRWKVAYTKYEVLDSPDLMSALTSQSDPAS